MTETPDATTETAADAAAPVERRRRRTLTNMSVATRLSLVALLVTLVSLAVTAVVGLQRGNDLAEGMAEDRLVTSASARASTIEVYLRSVRREVTALASSPGTAAALDAFSEGFRELSSTPPSADDTDALAQYYVTEVVPEIERVRGDRTGLGLLIPRQSAAIQLQVLYTLPGEAVDDQVAIEPVLVIDAGDGSAYSAAHARLHPVYGQVSVSSGFDDLFLIDVEDETIVYSVLKRTDFATSLDVGPHSNSSLATLIDMLADGTAPEVAAVIDFAPYGPVADQPRLFVASPVVDASDAVVGYLAVSLSPEPFDDIMSGGGEWAGLGDSGDVYVVGPDDTLRTETRGFAETPAAFTAVSDEPGAVELTSDQRRRIRETGTPALVQPIDASFLELAAEDGTASTANHRGIDVLATAWPVGVDGLDWTVVAEASAAEFDEPIEAYARNMLFAVALFVVAVTFVAVRWSERIIAPIRSIAARLRAVRKGTADAVAPTELPPNSPDEYLELASNIDLMLDRLVERRAAMEARAAERADIVAEFLPAGAAQRSAIGDDVLDHVPNATVAALSIEGVGELVEGAREGAGRDVLATVVDQLDELALEFGLERVKVTGTSYVAVCGVGRPFLDHAPRSVGFALAAVELVGDIAAEQGSPLSLRAGVDSGHISVGLAGRGGLVYDAWGEAVTAASELARASHTGAVAVSPAVRRQLPDDFVIVGADDDDSTAVVTGRVGQAVR